MGLNALVAINKWRTSVTVPSPSPSLFEVLNNQDSIDIPRQYIPPPPYAAVMGLKSGGRKLSFDVLGICGYDDAMDDGATNSLSRSISDQTSVLSPIKKKKRRRSRKGKVVQEKPVISEGVIKEISAINGDVSYSCTTGVITEAAVLSNVADGDGSCTVISLGLPQFGELRQRNGIVMNGENAELAGEESGSGRREEKLEEMDEWMPVEVINTEHLVELGGRKLEKEESLDWRKLMAEYPNDAPSVENSPMKYFMEEMYAGNSLRNTTSLGNDKERERVYDTIFRLPWRCELLINFGYFVCFDSFLSLLTIMPTRLFMTLWRLLRRRQFQRLSSAELSDFGCFVVLASGVTLLQQADISLIYHMIRGQSVIKLYVVYNVLEVFDRLCQSFGGDIMKALFNSADGLANSSADDMKFWLLRFISDEGLAITSSIIHSFILLAQAITLSTCIVSHNNALFAMLVSNNFAEIKSNVFKRYSKENVHSLVYFDSVERFHISAFVLFVLAQNIREAEGPWFESFVFNALVVYICEVIIDVIKHSFIAKFNDIKPIAFSEFLEELCKQTLNIQSESAKTSLTFVPLAPACVVIRVLQPVYAAHLPSNPLPWRLFWIFVLFAMTFVMLGSLKVMIGMGLRKFARWYINRCERRKLHSD